MLGQEAGIAPARTDVLEAKSTRRDRRQTERGSQYLAAAFAVGAVEDEDIGQITCPAALSSDRTQSGSRSGTQQCGVAAPAASSVSSLPVTGSRRNVVQPFSPLS